MPKPSRPDQSQYQEVLERLRRNYRIAVAAEKEIRAEALIDLDFIAGEQWDKKTKADRERGPSPRPCLVFNKVLPPVTQLGNQARQNKAAIQVSPVDSSGDVDTAKVLQGMVRHIEYDSDADQAYDTALFYAAACSFGYWRYTCEFVQGSFDQEIKAVTVEDPFSVYLDCFARKPDRSDAKWGFVLDKMSKDAHDAEYGPDTADLSSDLAQELSDDGWREEDGRTVAEYWEIETVEKTLRIRRAEDGSPHSEYLEDLKTHDDKNPGKLRPMTPEEIDALDWETDDAGEIKERIEEVPQVMVYITNGAEILKKPAKWDGSTIPIVKVTGLEVTIRGKKKIFSMTRFARDPQQLFNYYRTMEAESISLAPKPKFVGAVGQFKTKRRDWQRANVDNAAYLEYDLVAVGDKLSPEPQWRTFDPPVQALTIGAAAAADDIKSSTGYFDPSLGQTKGDQSGIAINSLQRQGDVSNFHFVDNLARAFKRGGRILVELIPKKYDTAREVRIIGDDQKQMVVKVNTLWKDEKGKEHHYRLDLGKYDVVVQQGASYLTQRKETQALIMALAQGNPQVWQMAADIFFENQDFAGADRLAKRFKAALPPALQDQDDKAEIPPQIQAQLAHDQQAIQFLQGQLQKLTALLQTKILDLESQERRNNENNRTKILTAEIGAKSSVMNAQAERDHDAVQNELDRRAELVHTAFTLEQEAAQTAQQQAQQGAP